MIEIDGSFGEGGGQIVRSSLALSLVTGRAFAIDKIRAGRKKPGLMRQHLTAVRAAAQVGQAEVEGDCVGSRRFEFVPGEVTPDDYHFSIGTAGYALATWSAAEAVGGANLYRHKDAYYFLPTEDEWFKAAYWNGASIQNYATKPGDTLHQGDGTSGTGWRARTAIPATAQVRRVACVAAIGTAVPAPWPPPAAATSSSRRARATA